jgi:hypothetical protein
MKKGASRPGWTEGGLHDYFTIQAKPKLAVLQKENTGWTDVLRRAYVICSAKAAQLAWKYVTTFRQ